MMISTRFQSVAAASAVKMIARTFLVLIVVSIAPADAQTRPDSFADLADRLLPAVVNISTSQVVENRRGGQDFRFPPGSPFEEFFREFRERQGDGQDQAPRRRSQALGSGFFISADGFVVTNNHVIEEADEISVIMQDGSEFDAELIGRDEKTDLAVLKVQSDEPLPFVPWGDSDIARVGEWVVAIGNPFGLGGSVTAGIISARQRDINSGPYDDYIQTDASINKGNSGGPLFNLQGEVIGINTAIFSPSGGSIGIGFAVPSAIATRVVDQLKEFGRTRRGWLGVSIQTVTEDIAEGLGMEAPGGALVATLSPSGPAENAGIRQGDVILTFDGKDVETMRRLPRIVAETEIGKDVPVEVWRDGEMVTLTAQVGELDEQQLAQMSGADKQTEQGRSTSEAVIEELGLTVANINDSLRGRFNLPDDAQGVVIVDVDGGSNAAEKGVRYCSGGHPYNREHHPAGPGSGGSGHGTKPPRRAASDRNLGRSALCGLAGG